MINEYLETLGKYIRYKKECVGNNIYRLYIKKNEMEFLEKSLQRLEVIDNTKPNEAMECLDEMFELSCDGRRPTCTLYEVVRQALLKAQEQEKVLDIVFKKNVRIDWVKTFDCAESYNRGLPIRERLTEEEFDLLKRYFK